MAGKEDLTNSNIDTPDQITYIQYWKQDTSGNGIHTGRDQIRSINWKLIRLKFFETIKIWRTYRNARVIWILQTLNLQLNQERKYWPDRQNDVENVFGNMNLAVHHFQAHCTHWKHSNKQHPSEQMDPYFETRDEHRMVWADNVVHKK